VCAYMPVGRKPVTKEIRELIFKMMSDCYSAQSGLFCFLFGHHLSGHHLTVVCRLARRTTLRCQMEMLLRLEKPTIISCSRSGWD
jgi:hypothetical protein